jgi:hypothetical protein
MLAAGTNPSLILLLCFAPFFHALYVTSLGLVAGVFCKRN